MILCVAFSNCKIPRKALITAMNYSEMHELHSVHFRYLFHCLFPLFAKPISNYFSSVTRFVFFLNTLFYKHTVHPSSYIHDRPPDCTWFIYQAVAKTLQKHPPVGNHSEIPLFKSPEKLSGQYYFYQIHYFSGKIFVSSVKPRIFALSFDAAFV